MSDLDEKTVARFWAKVDKAGPVHPTLGTACWLWTAALGNGYGRFSEAAGRHFNAHRWLYERAVGKVPSGLDLDHLCRVRACVNPSHLEPVTRRVNVLRGAGHPAKNAAKTKCPQGHPYAGDNLRVVAGQRRCRTCHNKQSAEWSARRAV